MIQVCLWEDGRVVSGGEELLDRPGPKWIDVLEPDAEVMGRLAERFQLHRLAVEDCLHLDQRPKLEEYPHHQFIVMQGFSCGSDVTELTLHEQHYFLAQDWLISVHALRLPGHDAILRRVKDDPAGTLGRGVDVILYLLADALVDAQFPIMDDFGDRLDDLEDAIFADPDPEHLQRIFQLKRALVTLRRVLSPQRDVVGMLSRRGIPQIQEKTTLYFRDVYDHLVRLYEQIDASRDVVGNVMDGYLSMVAQRTNDISKQLTIFATLFLPLSFIVGFFGQNFEQLTGGGWYTAMWVTMVGFPLGLVGWFKYKKWI
ncbi:MULTISPECIES: magnesium transporter CorA family protein [unclassified Corallococcus]|uniref:magnesium transporter CorA family protein n=1 Tax=unclassified Corallococcus TaxID=2685029 RepID=UPI001A8E83FB|nr:MULTISPECIES: magnesium transporter CorA family protein [unclassified Corallococcus]MBN9686294.1 magnesium transporter CorA family protein [Corallococcus sp. NCSPR001]WAS82275.1 magnesium transporter CorA family protein [Corallococcus sp. NCRR]